MIFFFLLLFLIVFLVVFSNKADKSMYFRNDAFISCLILLIFTTVFQAICLLSSFYSDNTKLLTVFNKVAYFLSLVFMFQICLYLIRFPKTNRSGVFSVVTFIFSVAVFFVVFYTITGISITKENGTVVTSDVVMQQFPVAWHVLLNSVFFYVLPLVSFLFLLCKRIDRGTATYAKKLMNIVAIVAFEFVYFLFMFAAKEIPLFTVMTPFAFTVLLAIIYKGGVSENVFDWKYIFQKIAEFLVIYIVPSCVCGIVVALFSFYVKQTWLYVLLTGVFVALMLFVIYRLEKAISKRFSSFTIDYEKQLEKELSAIDFSGSTDEVVGKLDLILSSNLGSENITILMNHGRNFEAVYKTPAEGSLSDDDEKQELSKVSSSLNYLSIPADNPVFYSVLSINRYIIFRNQLSQYVLSSVKDGMEALFRQTDSEVCVFFVEGHTLLGMMFLGKKQLGNSYSTYDYETLKKVYPHFFLVGYYMYSIANESVVGTVNREIKMSDQIIHSIQENMDFIKNPKVDVGYLMIPAHNIGGEFIDFIRLTDERHIFILGSMSGKGITASMTMVILKSIIRTFLKETKDFKELVQKVNMFIRSSLPRGTFFAGVFALMDFSQDVMYYINCGVPALFLYTQAYNNVIEIQGDGRILGFKQNVDKLLKVKKIKLSPGDVLFACTEGLIESHSLRGETFGKSRIQKSVVENLSYPASRIVQFAYDDLKEFTSKELEADITTVVFKYRAKQQAYVESIEPDAESPKQE